MGFYNLLLFIYFCINRSSFCFGIGSEGKGEVKDYRMDK
jgi:hypothetical protein